MLICEHKGLHASHSGSPDSVTGKRREKLTGLQKDTMCLETATRKPFPGGIVAAYLTFLFLVLFNSLNNAPSYISKTFVKGYVSSQDL